MTSKSILVTGFPGVGKTTLVCDVAGRLEEFRPVGFTTEEIRQRGERLGFTLSDLSGGKRVLAHLELGGPYRVGPYGVDVAGFEAFLDGIPFFDPSRRLVVVDEIGKMECFSSVFKMLVVRILEQRKPFVATVSRRGGGLMADIKNSPGVTLFEITRMNRDSLPDRITEEVRRILTGAPGRG